jgi:hypothetical protein
MVRVLSTVHWCYSFVLELHTSSSLSHISSRWRISLKLFRFCCLHTISSVGRLNQQLVTKSSRNIDSSLLHEHGVIRDILVQCSAVHNLVQDRVATTLNQADGRSSILVAEAWSRCSSLLVIACNDDDDDLFVVVLLRFLARPRPRPGCT